MSVNRSVIDFPIDPTAEAIKFVGRWLDINKLRAGEPNATIGPRVPMVDPDRTWTNGVLPASPYANARHVLAISYVPIPSLAPDPELFLFHAGFDAPETMTDPTKVAGFLAFLYPLSEAANLRERLGSVDYVSKT